MLAISPSSRTNGCSRTNYSGACSPSPIVGRDRASILGAKSSKTCAVLPRPAVAPTVFQHRPNRAPLAVTSWPTAMNRLTWEEGSFQPAGCLLGGITAAVASAELLLDVPTSVSLA